MTTVYYESHIWIYRSIYHYIVLSVILSIILSVCHSVYYSICLSFCLSFYLSVILSIIGTIIVKVVINQLNKYLNGYLDNFQSGFRAHHSTETVLIKIINQIRLNSDSGKISVLILLDIRAAFDIVDHNILLQRLKNWVGLSGIVLKWFRLLRSPTRLISCTALVLPVYAPTKSNNEKEPNCPSHHADDTQIYLALSLNDYSPIDSLCQCINDLTLGCARTCFS